MRLIERVWFKRDPARLWLVPLLFPFTMLFWLISAIRRSIFRLFPPANDKVTMPVVIVGNIGIGGNGKTPLTVFIVEQLKAKGLKPGVVSRGYGGKAESYPCVVNQDSTAAQVGDEPLLIHQRCNVPVVVGPDRVAATQKLAEQDCDIVIADDGLQHYKLPRAYEIIVVDGKRLFGNGLLLPAGPLREGTWRLDTVDAIVVNGGSNVFNEGSSNLIVNPMTLTAHSLVNVKTNEKLAISEFIEKNKDVNAIAGIGDPERFFSTLTQLNFSLDKKQGFVDHQAYNVEDFNEFSSEKALLMTEKDAVKCRHFAQDNWWYLPVDATFEGKEAEQLINQVAQLVEQPN